MRGRRVVAVAVGVLLPALVLVLVFGRGSDVPVEKARKGKFVRRVTAEGNLVAVKTTPLGAPMEADGPLKISWIAADGARVKANEVVVRFDAADATRELEDGSADRLVASKALEKHEATEKTTLRGLESDAGLAAREADAARTFASRDPEIFARRQILESEIDGELADARRAGAEGTARIRGRLFRAEKELIAIDGRKADFRIGEAKKTLTALEVRAPHDGILVLTRNWRGEVPRVGQSVWRGEPIGEIPDLAAMKADVFVLEADAGGLAVGAKATLTVESHPEKEIPATVTRVDGLARPRQRGNPVQYFGATVELSATDPSFMKPGQRVQARIVLDERDGVLSVPRQAVVEEKGKKLVFRRKRGRFEPVEVETGAFAPGRVEIRKGIAAGDEVALVDPRRLGDGAGTGAAAQAPPLPTAKGGAK